MKPRKTVLFFFSGYFAVAKIAIQLRWSHVHFILCLIGSYNLIFFTCLGADTTNVKLADAGLLLSDTLRDFMHSTGVDNGLTALGYKPEDIPALVKGTLPQHRVTKLALAGAHGEEDLARLFEDSMTLY